MRTMFRQGTDIEFNRPTNIGVIIDADNEDVLSDLQVITGTHASDHLYGSIVHVHVTQAALTDHILSATADFLVACENSRVRAYCGVVLVDPLRIQEGQRWAAQLNATVRKRSPHTREDELYGAVTSTVFRPSVTYASYHDFIMSVLDPDFDQLMVLGERQVPRGMLTGRLVEYDFNAAYRWS